MHPVRSGRLPRRHWPEVKETEIVNTPLVPDYYSVQETPVGRRWIYPLPGPVYAPEMRDVTSAGGAVEIRKGCAVADHALGEIVYFGPSSRELESATIKDESYVSAKLPATLTAEEYLSPCTCDHDHDCEWCDIRYRFYDTQFVDRPGERRTLDFSDYVELPNGGIDGYPEYAWSSSLHQNVLFSDAFHHLRPGMLLNTRALLKEALEQLPNVTKVYDNRDFSVYVAMQWEQPKTEHNPRRDSRGRKLNGTTTRTIATIEKSYDISVPYSITGESKADAVRKWLALRDKWIAFFTEANVTACSHCDGYGYFAPKVTR